jgi:hypothetical protein
MATTFATINQSLVDNAVVSALRSLKPMLSAFSYRPVTEGRIKSDIVYVPIATDPTAQSKTAGTAVTDNGTIAGTAVTLSNHYAAGWTANEGTMPASLFPAFWQDKIAGGVAALGKQVIDAGLALVTEANYGSTEGTDKLTIAIADFGLSDLTTLWQYAIAKIKGQRMSYGMNPAVAGAIFGESNIASAFAYNGTNYIQTGAVPQLLGMNTWMYGDFPNNNSEGMASAIFGQAAILACTAPIDDLIGVSGEIIERRNITDPETGIACTYTMYASGAGAVTGEVQLLYGVAKGQNAIVTHQVA